MQQDVKPLEDFAMWTMLQSHSSKVNIPALKESCGDLIRMTVQKSSGMQNGSPATHLSWENWERIRMNVLAAGVSLAVSGLLDGLGDAPAAQERDFKAEYPTWDFLHGDKCRKWDYRNTDTFDCLKPGKVESNIESLKHWVSVFVRYMKGETGYDDKVMKNAILCETVALVLSGKLDTLCDYELGGQQHEN